MRTYAIGDIHGHLDKLKEAHRRIAEDRARVRDNAAPVVHVGDLVDRGPDSRAVIDYLMRGHAAGQPWVTLKGNHDRMFTGFMADPDSHDPGLRAELHWIHPRLGGATTLASYGVERAEDRLLHDLHNEASSKVPGAHLAFLRDLPVSFVRGDALFVHAGIRPGVSLAEQTEDDLLWIRRDFHDHEGDHGYLVVHGHTPVDAVTHYGNRLNIDSGAGFDHALSTVVIEDGEVWLLDGFGREAIRPDAT